MVITYVASGAGQLGGDDSVEEEGDNEDENDGQDEGGDDASG